MRGIVWAEGGGAYKAKEALELSRLADACDAVEDLAAEAFEDIYEPTTPESAVSSPGKMLIDGILQEATTLPPIETLQSRARREDEEVLVVLKVFSTQSAVSSPMAGEPSEDGILAAFPKVPTSEPTTAATVLKVPRGYVTGDDLKGYILESPIVCKRLGLTRKNAAISTANRRDFALGKINLVGNFQAIADKEALSLSDREIIWVHLN